MQQIALEMLLSQYNIGVENSGNSGKIGSETLKNASQSGAQLIVRLGEDGILAENRYLHAIIIEIQNDGFADEAYTVLGERFPGVDFSNVASMGPMPSSAAHASRQYLVAADEALSGTLTVAKSASGTIKASGGTIPDWQITIRGTGAVARLPMDGRSRWITPLDPQAPALVSAELLRVAAGIVEDGKPQASPRRPRMSKVSLQDANRDLAILMTHPDGYASDQKLWLCVGRALHHQFDGSAAALQVFREFTATTNTFTAARAAEAWTNMDGAGRYTWQWLRAQIKDLILPACLDALEHTDLKSLRQQIALAAHYDLTATEIAIVGKTLADRSEAQGMDVGKTVIVADIKATMKAYRRENPGDKINIEREIARETLRRYFGGLDGPNLRRHRGMNLRYARGYWQDIDDDGLQSLVFETATTISDAYPELAEAIAGEDSTTSTVSKASRYLLHMATHPDMRDPMMRQTRPREPFFNCPNGEVRLIDGRFQLVRARAESRISHQLAVNYNPDAPEPKLFLQVLNQAFGALPDRDAVVRHWLEMAGYCCNGTRTKDVFGLTIGPGGTGKTTLHRVIAGIIGDAALISSLFKFDPIANKHCFTPLVGKIFVLDPEMKKGSDLPDDIVKMMGDAYGNFQADPKGTPTFEFTNHAVPWGVANHYPPVKDEGNALDRRAKVFPMVGMANGEKPEEIDNLFGVILETEAEGVLRVLVEHAQQLFARGDFEVPQSCLDALATWRGTRSTMGAFVADRCELQEEGLTLAIDLFRAYQDWAKEAGVHRPMTRPAFYEEVRQMRGVTAFASHNQGAYRGIRLRNFQKEQDDAQAAIVREREERRPKLVHG